MDHDFKVPPHSVQTEMAILGGLLQYPELFNEVAGELDTDHFYRTAHQLIFETMKECYRGQIDIDVVSLQANLADKGQLDAAGGFSYLADLAMGAIDGFMPTPESIKNWIRVVRKDAGRRALVTLGHELIEKATEPGHTDILEYAQKGFLEASDLMEIQRKPSISSLIDEARADIDERLFSTSGISGIPTGFRKLDQAINGLRPNKLIILAARSGVGKTAFSLNVAVNVILKEKRPVLFFSLEMTARELMERVIKLVAESGSDAKKLDAAADLIRQHEHLFIIEDKAGTSISEITAITQKTVAKRPDLGLVVVDYIGKVKPDANSQRYQNKAYEVEGVTWGLKTIAKTLSLPVLALCQMNRGIESRSGDDKKPRLSDLKDSGAIEQDADAVIFITVEEGKEHAPTIKVAKQRNGPTAEIPMLFMGHITKFKESLLSLDGGGATPEAMSG